MATLAQRIEDLLADKIGVEGDDSLLHRAIGAATPASPTEMAYRRVETLLAAWEELHREQAAIRALTLDPARAHRPLSEIARAMRGDPCFNCGEPLAAHVVQEGYSLVCPTDAAARTDDERFTYTHVDEGRVTTFDPDWVVAPGETLTDCLDERGFDVRDYAEGDGDWLFGITHEQMRALLAGDESIDDELATKLERLTGVSSRMWLALEHNYRVGLTAGKTRGA